MMMISTIVMYSQKKKSGTIYSEHPAIAVVESMQQALIKGDTIALASYLTDDFRAMNGMNNNPDAQGATKQSMINQSKWWANNFVYLSIERQGQAYPDALEYSDGDTWVQTWDVFRGVHDETGAKMDMPIHRLFVVNKDNKISRMITYDDGWVWKEFTERQNVRTNGTIYNQHDNINKVLRMMTALEHNDVDKAFSFFAENARFTNLDMKDGEFNTVAQEKEGFQGMLKDWTINSIDVVGYPDYMEYELGNTKVVMSWWSVSMTRKSDGKKIKLPLMMTHNFNDDGKITREAGYYTLAALSAK